MSPTSYQTAPPRSLILTHLGRTVKPELTYQPPVRNARGASETTLPKIPPPAPQHPHCQQRVRERVREHRIADSATLEEDRRIDQTGDRSGDPTVAVQKTECHR